MTDTSVYDKAKYHYGGDYPEGLADDQAFVHTGLYLGWLIDRGLCSEWFVAESAEQIARFEAREITGPEVYEWWDGCLLDTMLSDEGNAFSRHYFDFDRGQYLGDYEELLVGDLPTLYHVPNTWENYDRLKARVDERYAAWKQRQQQPPPPQQQSSRPDDAAAAPRPWWQFWRR